jgi:hypothetical protein
VRERFLLANSVQIRLAALNCAYILKVLLLYWYSYPATVPYALSNERLFFVNANHKSVSEPESDVQ